MASPGPCTAPGLNAEYHSASNIADLWIRNGGDPVRAAVMTAVALCESCEGDANALSSAGAIGLWQILPVHAAEYNLPVAALYDADTSAYVAVKLSGNGTNLAAWDTAYAAGEGLTRVSFLADPEPGSCAANRFPLIAHALGITGTTGPPQQTPGLNQGLVGSAPSPGSPTSTVRPAPGTVIPGTRAGIPRGQWAMPQLQVPPAYGSGWDNLTQLWGNDGAELLAGLHTQLYQLQTEFGGS